MHVVGYSNDFHGACAERFLLGAQHLLELPNGLAAEHAALTEPMAVGAHAVARAELGQDHVCVVVGCGPAGLAVIAALKIAGHSPIIAADFSGTKRALDERMGPILLSIRPSHRLTRAGTILACPRVASSTRV